MSALVDRTKAAQRRAADPAVSAWVSANAGAGKTRVLTERVARLLLNGAAPGRILCLTYTRAAAAEMKSRLFGTLGRWALAEDAALEAALYDLSGEAPGCATMARARRLFAAALDAPGGLRIETLHGFCQTALRRFPIEAGLAPGFTVLDERTAREWRERARRAVLADAAAAQEGDPLPQSVARLAVIAGDTGLAELVDAVLGTEDGREDPEGAVRRALNVPPGATAEQALAEFAAAFDPAAARALLPVLRRGAKHDRASADTLAAMLKAADDAALIEAAAGFLTKKGEIRKTLINKASSLEAPHAEAFLQELAEGVHAAIGRLQDLETAETAAALLILRDAVRGHYDAMKRRRAAVDYDDLVRRMADLLLDREAAQWVLFKLDGGIDHLLLDEAQDNSPQQWRILEALTAEFFAGQSARPVPRTVFAVGDDKQSIYGFQGADPRGFGQARSTMAGRASAAGAGFRAETLDVTFRCAQPILDVVDAVFADAAARAAVSDADEIRHFAARAGAAGLVELWEAECDEKKPERDHWTAPLDAAPERSARMRLVARLADRIAAMVSGGERLLAKDRPIRPDDILILVRRRSAMVDMLAAALRERGVPVAGADRLSITGHIAVQDLMAAARVALLPADNYALACLLKSPLIGFDEDRLFALAHGRQGTLFRTLTDRAPDDPALERARAWIEGLRARADFMPPFEFFARLLDEGGRRALVARLGADALDPLHAFLTLALEYEAEHPPSLEGFLHWAGRSAGEIKRDLDRPHGEVRIMTVHGAKGLEADVVILPDTAWRSTGHRGTGLLRAGDLLIYAPGGAGRRGPGADALKRAQDAREAAESLRLLYVALTRARERLYVMGAAGVNGFSDESWYHRLHNVIVRRGMAVQDSEGRTAWQIARPQNDPPELERVPPAQPVPPLPGWLARPAPAERPRPEPLSPSQLVPRRPGARRVMTSSREPALARGRLIHALLHRGVGHGADRDGLSALAARLMPGLAPEDYADAAREAAAVFAMAEAATVFGAGSRGEVPFAARLEALQGALVSGRIDRLVSGPDRVLAVDFKTDRAPPPPDRVPEPYLVQMAVYRAALAAIFPGRSVGCALIWTAAPRFDTLSAHDLDAAIAGISGRDHGCASPP